MGQAMTIDWGVVKWLLVVAKRLLAVVQWLLAVMQIGFFHWQA
jgi:hypothetical protein